MMDADRLPCEGSVGARWHSTATLGPSPVHQRGLAQSRRSRWTPPRSPTPQLALSSAAAQRCAEHPRAVPRCLQALAVRLFGIRQLFEVDVEAEQERWTRAWAALGPALQGSSVGEDWWAAPHADHLGEKEKCVLMAELAVLASVGCPGVGWRSVGQDVEACCGLHGFSSGVVRSTLSCSLPSGHLPARNMLVACCRRTYVCDA
jgi:hypothetical protein